MKISLPQQTGRLVESQKPTIKISRIRVKGEQSQAEFDDVISEEPLQITLAWQTLDDSQQHTQVFTITMRTPGDDIALALGLLHSEGQINGISALSAIDYDLSEDDGETLLANQLTAHFKPGHTPQLADFQRQLITQSSCGICGKTSLKSLELKAPKILDKTPAWLESKQLTGLPQKLCEQQSLFEQTGGVHAAALFDEQYQLLILKEDVGRHNAVDKVVGEQLHNHPLISSKHILLVSGRVSFELVQKAVVAGYPVLIAVGAPSSLAISAAKRFDLTLIGFTKPNSFNVYHGQWRIKATP